CRAGHAASGHLVDGNPGARAGRALPSWLCTRCGGALHQRARPVSIEAAMLKGILSKVFGTRHERERKRIQPIVDEINAHYARLQTVSEDELRGQTAKFRQVLAERTDALERRVAELKLLKHTTKDPAEREKIDLELGGGDGRGGIEKELRDEIAEVLDELLPEAFATAREAARRLCGSTVL